MSRRTRDILAYLIASALIVMGLTGSVAEVNQSMEVPNPESPEGFDSYLSFHYVAYVWLFLCSVGVALAAYNKTAKEIAVWNLRIDEEVRPGRSGIIISVGLWVAVLALGAGMILYHQAYAMPQNYVYYESQYRSSLEQTRTASVIGLIGVLVFAYGILLSRRPDFELVDEPVYYNRPLWQCAIVITSGMTIAVLAWTYSALEFNEYRERDAESDLNYVMMIGLSVSFVVTLIGLMMMARTGPSKRLRAQLFPKEQDGARKES